MKRLLLLLLIVSCTRLEYTSQVEVRLELPFGMSKAADPPENRIEDLNILVFNCEGELEESRYIPPREYDGKTAFNMPLPTGAPLTIAACANVGRQLKAGSLDELKALRHSLAYPDEYSRGIPLSGLVRVCLLPGEKTVRLPLERLMARVSVSVDRRALDKDVTLRFVSVKVGNCPRSATIFAPSKAERHEDCFTGGFAKTWNEADALNVDSSPGVSGEVSVYLMENAQGALPCEGKGWRGSIPKGEMQSVCSYLELSAEYHSPTFSTPPEEYLTFRFYIGSSPGNFDALRGRHYHFTVRPGADGLSGAWKGD